MENAVTILKGLADKKRFEIIDLLLKYDLCVGALANNLRISKAAVSQHLQVLRKAGLVKGEKRGYWTHYSVEKELLHQIANDLNELASQFPNPESICFRAYPDKNIPYGKEMLTMCKGQCEHPEKLKGKPEECTPEQIQECHGDTKNHPCEVQINIKPEPP